MMSMFDRPPSDEEDEKVEEQKSLPTGVVSGTASVSYVRLTCVLCVFVCDYTTFCSVSKVVGA